MATVAEATTALNAALSTLGDSIKAKIASAATAAATAQATADSAVAEGSDATFKMIINEATSIRVNDIASWDLATVMQNLNDSIDRYEVSGAVISVKMIDGGISSMVPSDTVSSISGNVIYVKNTTTTASTFQVTVLLPFKQK